MTRPKVLISDALSPAAVQIFKDRGIDVDFQPNLGKDKEKLAEIIGNYDGLAIRSATKATAKIIEKATRLKVIGRAGIGVDNVEIPAATAKGIIVMNTPFGNSITTAEHAITLMLALAREIPQADASTQAGKWEKNRFMGVEITGKTLGVIGCGDVYKRQIHLHPDAPSSRRVVFALAVLVALLFSKQLYVSSLSSYYIFYLIEKFGVSTQAAQLYLFIFLASNAAGAFFGGPLGDRFGLSLIHI